jgi:DUF2950 family protein
MVEEPISAKRSRTVRILRGVALALLVMNVLLSWFVILPKYWTRPRLIAQNEIGATGACRAYASAQTMSRSGSGDLPYFDYCHPYTTLVTRKGRNGKPMELISHDLAEARGGQGSPHYGYLFDDLKTIGGKSIDWVEDNGLCATPAKYGVTGQRTFIVSTNGTVYGKDLGKSIFVKDMPANPKAAGWEYAD